eukprot:TRINITY_DN16324_c0_g1_i1.p1 TRINITY_DN16324_c0_g1~~TRINITY_DN16324_c0_g1_i1.p1  ORF type:complete len:1302 (-),score=288.51 TRINITY_DN16324_c0_g1_i1:321-3725(-)
MAFWMVLLQVKLGHSAGATELLGYTDPDVEKHQEVKRGLLDPQAFEDTIAEKLSAYECHEAIELNLKCWSTLLGHIAGFATISAFARIQQTVNNSVLGAFAVPLLTMAFLFVVFRLFDHQRHKVANNDDNYVDEYERLWFAEVAETEDDIFGLAVSFLTVQAIRFALNGVLPNEAGEDEEGTVHSVFSVLLLLGVGIGLVMIHVLKLEVSESKFNEHVKERLGHWIRDVSCMCFAWCLYYSTWETFSGYVFMPGREAVAAVATALFVTAVSMLCVYRLDKIADHNSKSEELHDGLRAAIFAFPILIGFSWERSFDLAVEEVAKLSMILSVPFTKLLLALLLAVMVIPVWKMYILKTVKLAMEEATEARDIAAERQRSAGNGDIKTSLLLGEGEVNRKVSDGIVRVISGRQSFAMRSMRASLQSRHVAGIGTDFGLTHEQVSQIMDKHKHWKAHVPAPGDETQHATPSLQPVSTQETMLVDKSPRGIDHEHCTETLRAENARLQKLLEEARAAVSPTTHLHEEVRKQVANGVGQPHQEAVHQKRVSELEAEIRNIEAIKRSDERRLHDEYQGQIAELRDEVERAHQAQAISNQAHNTHVARVAELQGELDLVHEKHAAKMLVREKELHTTWAHNDGHATRELEGNYQRRIAELENEVRMAQAKHHMSEHNSDNVSEKRVAELETELHRATTTNAELEARVGEFEQALPQYENAIEKEKQVAERLRQHIMEAEEKLKVSEGRNAELEGALPAYQRHNEELERAIPEYEQRIAELEDELANGDAIVADAVQKQLQELQEHLDIHKQEKMDMKRDLDMRNEEVEMNIARIKELEASLAGGPRNEATLTSRLQEYERNLNLAAENEAANQARNAELEVELARAMAELNRVTAELARYDEGHASAMDIRDSEIKELRDQAAAQQSAAATHAQRSFDLQNTVTQLSTALTEKDVEISQLNELISASDEGKTLENKRLLDHIRELEMMLRDRQESSSPVASPKGAISPSSGRARVSAALAAPIGMRSHSTGGRRITLGAGGPPAVTAQATPPNSGGVSGGRGPSTVQPAVRTPIGASQAVSPTQQERRQPAMGQAKVSAKPVRRPLAVGQPAIVSPNLNASAARTSSSNPGHNIVRGVPSRR